MDALSAQRLLIAVWASPASQQWATVIFRRRQLLI
jgi:hypothetical protein